MSTSLTTNNSTGMVLAFTPEQKQLIKDTVAKGATDNELALWGAVVGYEGVYEVNRMGQIRSIPRRGPDRTLKGRVLKPGLHTGGYLGITLCRDGKPKTYFAHRLVAITFLLNPLNLPQVNHKDGDRKNNIVSNLEWCTPGQNIKHSFDHLNRALSGFCLPDYEGRFKLSDSQVVEIRKLRGEMRNKDVAIKFNIGRDYVSKIWTNKVR